MMCRFIRNIVDNLRLWLIIRIEKNIDGSMVYNKVIGEYEIKNDIVPIIILFHNPKKLFKLPDEFCRKYFFTEFEIVLIHAFTGNGSKHINNELSSPHQKLNLHDKIIVKVFDSVLNQIERANIQFVHRIDTHSKGDEEKAVLFFSKNISKVVNIPWFLSTTEDAGPWGSKIVWKIRILNENKTHAKNFYPLVKNHGKEFEIRFERNSKFRIISITKLDDADSDLDIYVVNMDECESLTYDINMNYNSYLDMS